MNPSLVFPTNISSVVLPELIYVDTNAIIEANFNRPNKKGVFDFFNKASSSNSMLTYSNHTLKELKETTHREVLIEDMYTNGFKGDPMSKKSPWKQYEDSGVNVGIKALSKYSEIVEFLNTYAPNLFYKIDIPNETILEFRTNRFIELGIAPKDALHAAIMHYNGINDIFTLDEGFIKVPGINIYASNFSLSRHYRRSNKTVEFNPLI